MKSANHDSVQPILAEQDFKNIPRIIKSLSKENWVLLIQHEAAVQHLFDVLSKESSDGRNEFVSIFVDKLADSNLTSTENFIKIIKNYHSHLFRHHFDEKFEFYNGLRQVLRDNTAFAQGFCTDFFRDSSTRADDFFGIWILNTICLVRTSLKNGEMIPYTIHLLTYVNMFLSWRLKLLRITMKIFF